MNSNFILWYYNNIAQQYNTYRQLLLYVCSSRAGQSRGDYCKRLHGLGDIVNSLQVNILIFWWWVPPPTPNNPSHPHATPSHPIPHSLLPLTPNFHLPPSQSTIRTHSTLAPLLPVIHPPIFPSPPTPHFTLSCAYISHNKHTGEFSPSYTLCVLLYPHPSFPRIHPLRCVNSYAQPVDNFPHFCG